jgi:hypothetical protein
MPQRPHRIRLDIVLALGIVACGVALLLWARGGPSQRPRRPVDRTADAVRDEFPALSNEEVAAIATEIVESTDPSARNIVLARHRPAYLARILQRKLDGNPIDPEPYRAFLAALTEHANDVPPEQLRALLRISRGANDDTATYVAAVDAMGASGNAAFESDLGGEGSPCAFVPYAKLAGKRAVPKLVRWIYLGPEPLPNGPEVFAVERAIEALGVIGDPELLPVLNHVGERQHMYRPAVERALGGFNDPAAATVAANMLSLPKAYPSTVNPDEGRWHSNYHSAARNVLLRWSEKVGAPRPQSLGQDDLQKWWEQNKGSFPDIDSIRGRFNPSRKFDVDPLAPRPASTRPL